MTPSTIPHGIVLSKSVMGANGRDGIRLATDIYRPARDGEPLPGAVSDDPVPHAIRT